MKQVFIRFASDYGMIFVLLLLCVYYSFATYSEQYSTGADAANQLAAEIPQGQSVIAVGGDSPDEKLFVSTLAWRTQVVAQVNGEPSDLRVALQELVRDNTTIDVIAVSHTAQGWTLFDNFQSKFPSLGSAKIISPRPYRWPAFLNGANLLNVASQIAVIAIIAIGMTLVIITAGIDLSVGSLAALASVISALLIRRWGAEDASTSAMLAACFTAILACTIVGALSGVMVTLFDIPAFITTLATMQIASGAAYLLSQNQSINQIPPGFIWLGRGATGGIPHAVILMVLLYFVAHILMSRMAFGRHVYAVGGNIEAARLSGIPVRKVLVLVYAISGALGGLGGVMLASQFKSGNGNYGLSYELYVIAAVVVGGTSLTGGEGRVFGTLIGAFIIAVVQNGMNLTGVETNTQKIVLGFMILGAVLLDKLKKEGFRRRST